MIIDDDLRFIQLWGMTAIMSLVEPHEFDVLQVSELGQTTVEMGVHWGIFQSATLISLMRAFKTAG